VTQHMMRYTVKPDQAAHNEELVRAVFDELRRVQPVGLRYAAFKLDDGVSFIHLIGRDTEHGHGPVPQLEALRAFHAGIRERCDEAPVRTELSEIGSFGLYEKPMSIGL
jgi:hypothetical protein